MQPQLKTVEYLLEASEFSWEITHGKTIAAWGFNNQVPGPLLKASKGDTLVVKVKNSLPEPTVIHWHGIRLPASMDGTGEVQKPIQPGETFEYRFVVPDAGTFWYHSHHNETVQVERGMYGGIVIEDEADPVTDGEKVSQLLPTGEPSEIKKLNELHVLSGEITKQEQLHITGISIVTYNPDNKAYIFEVCLKRIQGQYGDGLQAFVKRLLDYN